MSNLVTVWDLEGNVFEVSRANANDLTTHLGWTTFDPKLKKEAPATSAEIEAVEEEAVVETAEEEEAPAEEGAAPKRGRPRKA